MALDAGSLYRLLAWLSPSYPIGAFSYSHGLEAAIDAGLVGDRASLVRWIAHVLAHGAGCVDAVLLREAHAAAADNAQFDSLRLDALNELALAWRGTAELALESAQQGTSFLTITRRAWPHPLLQDFAARHDTVALPVAVGLAAALHSVPAVAAISGYLHAFSANLISAAVRIVPLGQTDGQLALAELAPVTEAVAARAQLQDLETLGTSAPMVDWCSMQHENQYTRLFRS